MYIHILEYENEICIYSFTNKSKIKKPLILDEM